MDKFKEQAVLFAAFLKNVSKAFFDITEADNNVSASTKVAKTAAQRAVYAVADYWLMFASGAFIITMDKHFGYGWVGLFLLMWAFDLVVAGAFVVLWKRTEEDITLGVNSRRAVDAISHGSKIAGYMAYTVVVVRGAFWDGPEYIVSYFHKEITTVFRIILVLLVLTAIQAAIWTPIYILGFDAATDLFGYLKEQLF